MWKEHYEVAWNCTGNEDSMKMKSIFGTENGKRGGCGERNREQGKYVKEEAAYEKGQL